MTSQTAEEVQPAGVTLACFGDTHCGSTVGVMRPKQYQFGETNVVSNPARRSLYRVFKDYAYTIRDKRQGKRLVTVLMGDLVDGVHHGTKQLLTHYAHEQRAIFLDLAHEFMQIVGYSSSDGDKIYVLHGTNVRETHGTPSDTHEIGKELGAVPFIPPKIELAELDEFGRPNETGGEYGWQDLELDIYGNLVQLTHHAPTGRGTRAHTYGNTMRSWARSHQMILDARRKPIPRYVIWGHKHTAHEEPVRFDNGKSGGAWTTAVCIPAFQGKSDWVKQALPLVQPTSIGGWWANFEPDGSTYSGLEYVELNLERKPEKIA